MDTNQNAAPCIFCGANTEERHTSSIGVIFIHSECLGDLEEILSGVRGREEEEVGEQTQN